MPDFSTYTVRNSLPLGALNDVATVALGLNSLGGTITISGNFVGTISFTSDPGTGTYGAQSLTSTVGAAGSTFVGLGVASTYTNTFLIPTGLAGLKATMTSFTSGVANVSWSYSAYNSYFEHDLRTLRIARRQALYMDSLGIYAQTVDYAATGSSALATTQTLYGNMISLLAGDPVSTLHVGLAVIGVSVTLAKAGLYTKTGNTLVASCADASATMNGSAGIKPLTMSATYFPSTDDVFYGSFLAVGVGTQPTLLQAKGAVATTGAINSGVIQCVTMAAQTDLPATATFIAAAGARTFWMGVS